MGWRGYENSMMSAQPACFLLSAPPRYHFRPRGAIYRRATSKGSHLSIMRADPVAGGRGDREPQQWAGCLILIKARKKQYSLLKTQTTNKTLQEIMKNM